MDIPLGVDLNMKLPQSEIDTLQEKTLLPDLNLEIDTLQVKATLPDLNLSPRSPSTEISQNHLLDLNGGDPCMENDMLQEVEFQTFQELSDDSTDGDGDYDDNEDADLAQLSSHTNKNLSNDQRRALYEVLLEKSIGGKLKRGVTKMVASQFSVTMRTVQRIWKQSKTIGMLGNVAQKRTGNCGRKRIQVDFNRIREIPLRQRTNLRSLAYSLNMKQTTLFRRLQSGDLRRHSNAIKPILKEENKKSRLEFCISMLDGGSISHDPVFTGMYNIIHIDEKWFYLTKKSENYYLLPDEEDPIRTCKSKNFIGKVMFLTAVARPRFDAQGKETFSGKIGIFPFVTQEPAKRTSVNRIAGTLETKPITSVNKDVIRSFLIEKVVPAIKAKWPREDSSYPIFIQQDNAKTHINRNDEEFCQVATADGYDIRLMCQPPNSPDLNVLDLGFFNAIQSLQHKESPKTIDELISAVMRSFEAFSTTQSNRIFLTLQLCMIEIMRAKGSHKYKIPHVNKAKLEREGELPTQMKCDPELVQEVLNYLS